MKKRLFSLIALMFAVFLLVGCTKNLELKEMKYEAQTEVTKIEIEEPNMPIEILKNKNEDNVVISYYSDDEYKLNIEMSNSSKTLTLKREEDKTAFAPVITFQSTCKTTIYIPENYEGSIDVTVANGSVKAQGITLQKLEITASNGEVSLKNVIVKEEASIETANGSITFDDTNIKKLNVEAANGSLNAKESNFNDRFECKIHNGSVKFNNVEANEFDINVTNGETTLSRVECGTLLSVKTVTGSILVELKGNELDYKTTLSANVGSVKGKTTSGNKTVNCSTNVGSVEVRYLG